VFEQVVIDFLPETKEVFLNALGRIKKRAKPPLVLVARFEDFDEFFEALLKTKNRANVHNAAMAIRRWPSFCQKIFNLPALNERDGGSTSDCCDLTEQPLPPPR
jgi:hypothetical protein